MKPRRRTAWLLAAALVLVTLAAYEPVRHNGFVSYDDHVYVLDNAHVKEGLSWPAIAWAFTTVEANFWHPLTWLSIELDVQVHGLDAPMHHATSVLLHLASTLLLFVLLRRATGHDGPSAFVAALFAVHPLHVESVAWVSERKDTLSTVFWMSALWCYVLYTEHRRWWRYLLVGVCLALGLMAKPMLVTLPFVLLLFDVWPLERASLPRRSDDRLGAKAGLPRRSDDRLGAKAGLPRRSDDRLGAKAGAWLPLVGEKVPLFLLAGLAGVVTIVAEHHGGAVADTISFPLTFRIANALTAAVRYPVAMVWPARLVPFYPYPQAIPVLPAIASAVVLVAVTWFVVRALPRAPYLAVGWFWYLVTLLPVSGLIQVGSHAMADRYTYVPLIGLFIAVAWGAADVAARFRATRWLIPAVAVVLLFGCAVVTRAQVRTWKDSDTLWRHALDVMPDNYYAHNAYGLELQKKGRMADAMAHFVESGRLAPGFPNARENVGAILADQGRIPEAIAQYEQALALAPGRVRAHVNLANELVRTGRLDEAIVHYREALRLDPASASAHANLGTALQASGRLEEAIGEQRQAIELDPGFADAHYNLANALQWAGRLQEAAAEYEAALRLGPDSAGAHNNLGAVLQAMGRPAEAVAHYERSLQLDPGSAQAFGNLGVLLLGAGKPDQAADRFRAALRIDPSNAQMHTNLGSALQDLGRLDEAIAEHREAIRLRPDFADAHYNLANALLAQGRLEAAAAEYRETLRLEGESPEVRAALNAVLKKLER